MTTCMTLFLSGDGSGSGKSTFAMAILSYALKSGYSASSLAYIKPCTQCERVQFISKFASESGITHVDIGPIVYYAGYTREVIDGESESLSVRKQKIVNAVNALKQDRKLVIVDGVGYPGVGSCVGLSNGTVASLLSSPVLLIGRPGVGNAIDSMMQCRSFFIHTNNNNFSTNNHENKNENKKNGDASSSTSSSSSSSSSSSTTTHSRVRQTRVLGCIFNKVGGDALSYHSFDECKRLTTKYFENEFNNNNNDNNDNDNGNEGGENNRFSVYGHVPVVSATGAGDDVSEVTCALKPSVTKTTASASTSTSASTAITTADLTWREGERIRAHELVDNIIKHCNFDKLFADLKHFHGITETGN